MKSESKSKTLSFLRSPVTCTDIPKHGAYGLHNPCRGCYNPLVKERALVELWGLGLRGRVLIRKKMVVLVLVVRMPIVTVKAMLFLQPFRCVGQRSTTSAASCHAGHLQV